MVAPVAGVSQTLRALLEPEVAGVGPGHRDRRPPVVRPVELTVEPHLEADPQQPGDRAARSRRRAPACVEHVDVVRPDQRGRRAG